MRDLSNLTSRLTVYFILLELTNNRQFAMSFKTKLEPRQRYSCGVFIDAMLMEWMQSYKQTFTRSNTEQAKEGLWPHTTIVSSAA